MIGMIVSWVAAAVVAVSGAGFDASRWVVETVAGTGAHGAVDGEAAQFNMPGSVFYRNGVLYVVDTFNNAVRVIEDGYVTHFTGTVLENDAHGFPVGAHEDGRWDVAQFNRPTGGMIGGWGELYIVDSENHAIRVVDGAGQRAWGGGFVGSVRTMAGGEAGYVNGPLAYAQFNLPTSIALGFYSSLFITDTLNHVIREICVNGYVTTIAGIAGQYGYACADTGAALFNMPMGIAINNAGDIFIADTGNHLIRVLERHGDTWHTRTLAGSIIFPSEVAWDDYEDADFDEEPLGGFADGADALFNLPIGLTLWGDMLVVADSANHRIRGILPCGYTRTLAGTGYADYLGGTANEAAFHFPRGVQAVGERLYIADTGNNTIRVLTAAPVEAPVLQRRCLICR